MRVVHHLSVGLLSSLLAAGPVQAEPAGLSLPPVTEAGFVPSLDPPAHVAPLPSAAVAGMLLLSVTAAHRFGRRRL